MASAELIPMCHYLFNKTEAKMEEKCVKKYTP